MTSLKISATLANSWKMLMQSIRPSVVRAEAVEEAFHSVRRQAIRLSKRIKNELSKELGDTQSLEILLLGECVDQGLRPPEAYRYIFTTEKNPEWRQYLKRCPEARMRASPFELSLSARSIPNPPSVYRLTAKICKPGSLPPPEWWPDEIVARWHRLDLTTPIPQGLFLLRKRHTLLSLPGLVNTMHKAALQGLARLLPSQSTNGNSINPEKPAGTEAVKSNGDPDVAGDFPQVQAEEPQPPAIRWSHSEEEPRPSQYAYGPISGTKKDLAKWYLPGKADPRAFQTAGEEGRVWIVRRSRNYFDVYFTTQNKYAEANAKKLGHHR
jgi:hypothetical protein